MKLRILPVLLLLAACTVAPQAQEKPGPADPPEKPKLAKGGGPDELFTPLPTDGLREGSVPERQHKAVLLRVPNAGSWKEAPDKDLKSSYRALSGAVRLRVEQRLEAAPELYPEENTQRVEFFKARLRALETPNVDSPHEIGKSYAGPVAAERAFNAEYIVLLSFARTEDGANAGVYIHQRENGLVSARVFPLLKPDKESPSKAVRHIQANVDAALEVLISPLVSIEGVITRVKPQPVPDLVSTDTALKPFVKMRGYMEVGELSRAYVEFETLNKLEPGNGRAALYGMEIFRGLADQQEAEAERQKFLQRSLKVGRDALAKNPNEVLLRGKMAWNAFTFYWRRKWAVEQIDIALKIQPANMNLLSWRGNIVFWENKAEQFNWVRDNVLPKVKDGRAELELGNIEFNQGKHAKGVEWYKKALEISPGEHEFHVSLGLCSTYLAESLAKKAMPGAAGVETRKQRDATFNQAAKAMEAAQDIDPTVVKWVYEYYVRAATHGFKLIPADADRRYRVFFSQAVMNGLEDNSRTWEWQRLVKDVIEVWRDRVRKDVKELSPEDPLFSLKLQARLVISAVDSDTKDRVAALWTMRKHGIRSAAYYSWMNSLGPVVEDYEPPTDDPDNAEEPSEE